MHLVEVVLKFLTHFECVFSQNLWRRVLHTHAGPIFPKVQGGVRVPAYDSSFPKVLNICDKTWKKLHSKRVEKMGDLHSKRVEKMGELHSKRVEKMGELHSKRVEKMGELHSKRVEKIPCMWAVVASPIFLELYFWNLKN